MGKMTLSLKTLFLCFWRTYFIGANFNTKGFQNIGLTYAVEPGLKELYPNPDNFQKARKRYLSLYNTHPFWSPLLVGYFLFLEIQSTKGLMSIDSLNKVKTTASYTLSALGDTFFGGALLIFWSLSTVIFFILGFKLIACLWSTFFFIGLHLFKIYTFWLGWRRGLIFFQQLRTIDIINWSQRIKYINAGLLLIIWFLISPFITSTGCFAIASMFLGFAAWSVYKRYLSREILLTSMATFYIFYQWLIS